MSATEPIVRTAAFSRNGRYRYRLARRWAPGEGFVLWVMLNPSLADASSDDPTTRRVMALSRSWGFDGCEVVNLFAYRASSPAALRHLRDPEGPANRAALRRAVRSATTGIAVVAWGAWTATGLGVADAAARVGGLMRRAGVRPVVLARNRDGSPRHPLYVPADARYSYLE